VAPHYNALILLNFGDMAEWSKWASGRTAVETVVDDLGDAAFLGPKTKADPTMLAFRKGSRGVRLTTTKLNDDGTWAVSMDQLRQIADLIESRME
jgi:hypothetical protein